MNFIFKTSDVVNMINHWLSTPPNGYVGVTYGRNLSEFLLIPMSDDRADELLSWIRQDIPVLKSLSDNDLSIVSEQINHDQKKYSIKIGQILIPIQDN